MSTILVEIAAYRDDELPKTIASCLAQAAEPERLRFAIVHQYGPETKGQLSTYRHDDRFTIIERNWLEARGVGVARAECDQLYGGEDFYLQIDSHMRFEANWDARLERQWRACANPKAILSSYPQAFRYDEQGSEVFIASLPNRLIVHDMFMGTIPTFFGKNLPGSPDAPVRGAFVAGGLQFGPGSRLVDVPYESQIWFIGEEVVHSLRLFFAEYDVYSLIDQPIYHLYIRSKHQKNAHHYWHDFLADPALKDLYHALNDRSYAKVARYLAGEEDVPIQIVHKFERFAGVDFKTRTVHPLQAQAPPLPVASNDEWRSSAVPPIKMG